MRTLRILGLSVLVYSILFLFIHVRPDKTNRSSSTIGSIRGRSLTQNESSENKKDQARILSAVSGTKKSSTLLPSFEEPFNLTKKESPGLKVYVYTVGRTGNMIFQYVAGLGIAHHNNMSAVFNPKMIKLKEIFPKIELNFLNDTPKWPLIVETRKHAFDPMFFHLSKINVKIGYAFNSFKYFDDIFGYLYNRTLSYFDESLFTKATKLIQTVKYNYTQMNKLESKETKITSVCVHVRRGDFLSEHNIRVGHIVPSSLDIQNAMNYMQNKFKHTVFIVMSNDVRWCKENLNRSNVYFSTNFSANEDFVLMCNCDHMIMTVGSFGWWGAWFTSWRGGIAMYYDHQFTTNTKMYHSLNRHDWFPSNWLAYTNMTVIESKYLGDK